VTDETLQSLAPSNTVGPCETAAVEAFGTRLVLWRTASGRAQVTDRACPHLGANLARLGIVRGETLVCRSHKWTYDCDGVCVAAPGEDSLPAIRLTSFPTHECDGHIWVARNDEE
jgi:phenylpropionate dioxygenase-like ring-hydroxylating dioxygenase large terminal subunit